MTGAIAKILLVFAAMLVAARLRVPLGLALMAGGAGLCLWAGLTPALAGQAVADSFLTAEMWLMLAVTTLIVEIGRFMTEDQNASEILRATRRWGGRHGRALGLMAMPAVIGLIPMPAGALFSAPFVEEAGGRHESSAEWKTAVNYWFRHVWEYWWPLYPGVIVAMAVFDIDAWKFVSAQFPYTLVAFAAGYGFLIRPHVERLASGGGDTAGSNRRVLFLMLPLLAVVVAIFVAPPLLSLWLPALEPQNVKLMAVLLGLGCALVVMLWDEARAARRHAEAVRADAAGDRPKGPSSRVFSTLFTRKTGGVALTLMGILVFKFMLIRSGLLPEASRELMASGVPVAAAVAALPFLAGLVTGLALGFTGVSFPLVVGLMAAPASGLRPVSTLVLAYGFGYMGMMLSPVHLCLLVTRDYFDSNVRGVYWRILPCVLCIMVYCLAAYFALRACGW